MSGRRTARILVIAGTTIAVAACNLLAGIGTQAFHVADAGDLADGGRPARCATGASPPARPDVADNGGGRRFVFAVSRFDFSSRTDAGAPVGYDLDGVCSCSADDSVHAGTPSCLPPDSSANDGCDEDGGVDNAVTHLETLVGLAHDALDMPTKAAVCGQRTVLMVLDNYNGKADDPDVAIGFVASFGMKDDQPGGPRLEDPGCNRESVSAPPWPARLDGTDVWSYRSADYNGRVPLHPLSGWVRNYQLVIDARSADSVDRSNNLAFLVGAHILSIGSVVLTADLLPLDADGGRLAIDDAGLVQADHFALGRGVVTGRVTSTDLLITFGELNVGAETEAGVGYLCNSPLYGVIVGLVCGGVDTMNVPGLDFKSQPCNALSFAMQFDAVPASLGDAGDATSRNSCGDNFAPTCP